MTTRLFAMLALLAAAMSIPAEAQQAARVHRVGIVAISSTPSPEESLANAIALILEDSRKDDLRGVPTSAKREKVVVGCSGAGV